MEDRGSRARPSTQFVKPRQTVRTYHDCFAVDVKLVPWSLAAAAEAAGNRSLQS